MNTEMSTTENPPSPDSPDQSGPGRSGAGLAWFSLFVALSSLAASGWLWWQKAGEEQSATDQIAADLKSQAAQLAEADSRSVALESKLSSLLAANPDRRLTELEQDVDSLRQSTSERQAVDEDAEGRMRSIQAALENVQARQAAAESRLSALSARTVDGSAELDIAEVDYLLRLAQERLTLFADVSSADRALEIAGRHLAAFDNPMFLGVEQEIAAARQQLSLAQPPDYRALEQKLDLIQASVPNLTFKGGDQAAGTQGQVPDTGLWARIRNSFSGLVTVRRSTADERDLPVLADRELVRQRLWLQLEVARWAAVRREQDAYTAALGRLSETLDRWFEPPGMDLVTNLRELREQNVDPALPDISAPWTTLRALQGIGLSRSSRNEPEPPTDRPAESPSQDDPGDQLQEVGASAGDMSQ